jgi:hypothetical protein
MVVAILHFVFGGISLVFGVCGAGVMLAGGNQLFNFGGQQAQQEEQQAELEKALEALPAYKAIQYGEMGLGIMLSLMMIVSGIGLLRMQSWGRVLSISYAFLSIASKIFTAVYAIVFTAPVTIQFVRSTFLKGLPAAPNQPALSAQQQETMAKFMEIAIYLKIAFPLITIVYPLVVLVIMLLPSTRAAFRREDIPTQHEDLPDYRDEPEVDG